LSGGGGREEWLQMTVGSLDDLHHHAVRKGRSRTEEVDCELVEKDEE